MSRGQGRIAGCGPAATFSICHTSFAKLLGAYLKAAWETHVCYAALAFSLPLLLSFALPAAAQQWAQKMFSATKHDFGPVARGSKAEFEFQVENVFKEDIHIAAVRSSCGCTSPSVTHDTLKTYEKGAIVAKLNTASFLGHRSATITVVIDKPYYAEVQLQVSGFIRSDVVFEPGLINFGQLEQARRRGAGAGELCRP